MGGFGWTVPFLAIICVLSHEPLFTLELGDLTCVLVLVRSWKEGLHPMVFEFGLERRVRLVRYESVYRYPLSAVGVRCTQPADCAWVISKCVELWC